MTPLLGCIADDLTGATDLAGILAKKGMRTILITDPSVSGAMADTTDAIVVALKSRTIPAPEAIELSLASLSGLRRLGVEQYLFKYCSTFDSTAAGNIGPVADALLAALGQDFTIVSPALPENGRTVYQGHLFVNGTLLSESSMRHHPLTPMTESRLETLLGSQTPAKVGLVGYETVTVGSRAIRDCLADLRRSGHRYAVVDALKDEHLHAIAEAVDDLVLITGGSGIAHGLAENFRRRGKLVPSFVPLDMHLDDGPAAVIAGSCSAATLAQIDEVKHQVPSFRLDPLELACDRGVLARLIDDARAQLRHGHVLVYASATPDEVRRNQADLGLAAASELVEKALAETAAALVEAGLTRLVVAGGETSGAVVARLGLKSMRVGREIDPGVPWMFQTEGRPLAVALKSGNFGKRDFFLRVLAA